MSNAFLIQRLCIVGVGLIGGSLALALKAAAACGEIVGAGRNEAHLRDAVALGVIDRYETDIGLAVHGAEVVVIAVPPSAMEAQLRALPATLAPGAVITDVGSTKVSVLAAAERVWGHVPPWLVPAHPIAGTEKSGVSAAHAELFHHRHVILTPLPHTDPAALTLIRVLWEQTGAKVATMEAPMHDDVFAALSHLPHVLAYALMDSLRAGGASGLAYAGSGLKDTTRIAASNPCMWSDICIANRTALLAHLQRFQATLQQVTQALNDNRGDHLLEIFASGKRLRDELTELNGSAVDA